MTEERKKRIHLIYGIISGVAAVVAGICLIIACVGIYNSGDQPFSRESVATSFSGIAVPVYLCLTLVIGGFILDLLCPLEKKRLTAGRSVALTLQRLHMRTDLTSYDASLRTSILAEQKKRKLHAAISAVLLCIGCGVFLTYALNPGNFDSVQINLSMINAMWVLIPCLILPFVYIVFTLFFAAGSMQREIDLLKQADTCGCRPKEDIRAETQQQLVAATRKEKGFLLLRYALLLVGAVFLVYGFATGGVIDVLTKAVNICTECIGLG